MNIFGVTYVILQCTIFTMNLETPEQSQRITDSIDNVNNETESESSHYEIDSRSSVDCFGSAHCTFSQTFDGSSETLLPIVTPNQPKHRKNFKTKLFESRERSFQASSFENFPWLHYDEGFDVERCYVCYRQSQKNTFDSLQKSRKCFYKHKLFELEKCTWKFQKTRDIFMSSYCYFLWQCFVRSKWKYFGINNRKFEESNGYESPMFNFIKIIECCRVLATQNIAFQSASEFNSNFHQVLKF